MTPEDTNKTKIQTLCTELAACLNTSTDTIEGTLRHQSEILSKLMAAYLKDTIAAAQKNGYLSADRLNLTLRIQRQCTETIKTAATIDYMQSLTPRKIISLPPKNTATAPTNPKP